VSSADRTWQTASTRALQPNRWPSSSLTLQWPWSLTLERTRAHACIPPLTSHPAPPPPSRDAWLRTPTLLEHPPTPTPPRPHPPTPTSLRKKIAAQKKTAAAKAAQDKADDAKGLPKWNLFRVLPKQTAQNTRPIDGSLRFPKPWGKGFFD
jgi:hypothetical protein